MRRLRTCVPAPRDRRRGAATAPARRRPRSPTRGAGGARPGGSSPSPHLDEPVVRFPVRGVDLVLVEPLLPEAHEVRPAELLGREVDLPERGELRAVPAVGL